MEARMYTYRGETHSLWEWAKILNMPVSTVYRRARNGLDVEEILSDHGVHPRKGQHTVPSCGARRMQDCFECQLADCLAPANIRLEGESYRDTGGEK